MEVFGCVWAGFSQGWQLIGRRIYLSGSRPDLESRCSGNESEGTDEGRQGTAAVWGQVQVLVQLLGNSCPDTRELRPNTDLPHQCLTLPRSCSLHFQKFLWSSWTLLPPHPHRLLWMISLLSQAHLKECENILDFALYISSVQLKIQLKTFSCG